MAPSEREQTPEAVPANQQPGASREKSRGVRWRWLVIAAAALLGLIAGVSLVLRGRSLDSSAIAGSLGRPTFVIAASASPLPSASPSPPEVARSAAGVAYVVQPGDTLRSIAQDAYGDADEWRRIYDANRELIGADPDALQAGMRLTVP